MLDTFDALRETVSVTQRGYLRTQMLGDINAAEEDALDEISKHERRIDDLTRMLRKADERIKELQAKNEYLSGELDNAVSQLYDLTGDYCDTCESEYRDMAKQAQKSNNLLCCVIVSLLAMMRDE